MTPAVGIYGGYGELEMVQTLWYQIDPDSSATDFSI